MNIVTKSPQRKLADAIGLLREACKTHGEDSLVRQAEHLLIELQGDIGGDDNSHRPRNKETENWKDYFQRIKLLPR